MSLGAIIKSHAGIDNDPKTIASAATIYLDDNNDQYIISGSETLTALYSNLIRPGRTVRFIGAASAAAVFTNTNDASTNGTMDLGGSNVTLNGQDFLALRQQSSGAWVKVGTVDN